jgi:hypothetical protein
MNKKHRRDDFNKKNNIKPVEKGTKEFMSRKQLERKAREMKATKRSIRTVSEVRLDTNEEDILLSLIARLKNIKLVEKTEDLPVDPKSRLASINENEDSDNSDTDSNEDDDSEGNSSSDSDEEGKEDNSEPEVDPLPKPVSETTVKTGETEDVENIQSKSVMLKPAFVRKLIRDDRYQRKLLSTGQVQSSERVAAKIRRTLENSKSSSSSDSIIQKHNAVASSSGAGNISSTTISSSSAVKPGPAVSSTVRMLVDCPKGGKASKGQPKVMVFNRSLSTSDIIAQIRPKFNATAKFNALKIVSENKNLDDFELMTLPDGELIHLIQDKPTPESYQRKEKYSSGVLPPKSPLLDDEQAIKAVGTLKTAEEQVENDTSSQPDGKLKEENDGNAQMEPTAEVQDETVLLNLLHEENEFYSEHYDNKSLLPNPSVSEEICRSFLQFQSSQNKEIQQKISAQRLSLPIYQHKNEILSLIANNQVILISGETGSGKTTQLPSYILEEIIVNQRKGAECNIAVTQPRRIAAVSIAERVSYELYGSNNTVGKDLIGYQVRLDAKYGEKTRLLYCTTGVLLRKLQNPDYLRNLSHIVIDEIHERTVETDFLLTIIKQQLPNYPNLRIVSGKKFLLFCFIVIFFFWFSY